MRAASPTNSAHIAETDRSGAAHGWHRSFLGNSGVFRKSCNSKAEFSPGTGIDSPSFSPANSRRVSLPGRTTRKAALEMKSAIKVFACTRRELTDANPPPASGDHLGLRGQCAFNHFRKDRVLASFFNQSQAGFPRCAFRARPGASAQFSGQWGRQTPKSARSLCQTLRHEEPPQSMKIRVSRRPCK